MNDDKEMTDTRKDGGPAFPRTWTDGSNGEYWTASSVGMTLRDYLAAAALSALGDINPHLPDDPAGPHWPEPDELARRRAKAAYLQADAMLDERSK